MIRFPHLFLVIFFVYDSKEVISQSLKYDVVRGDKSIGYMEVSRKIQDSLEVIEIKSSVSFKILFSFTVNYQSEEVFYLGEMISGHSSNTLNGSMQRSVKTIKTDNGYTLNFGGVPSTISTKSITYTVSRLYFEEPLGNPKAFSQTFGEFFSFGKLGDQQYKMTTPDGDNYYNYLNGVCTEVKVVRDYANYSFVMKPESLDMVMAEGNKSFRKQNK